MRMHTWEIAWPGPVTETGKDVETIAVKRCLMQLTMWRNQLDESCSQCLVISVDCELVRTVCKTSHMAAEMPCHKMGTQS